MLIVAVFLAAGFIKGIVGFGLPTLALVIFAIVAPLPAAIAVMIVPSLVTNVWQAVQGGHLVQLCRRLWPLFLFAFVGIFLTARLIQPEYEPFLKFLLGVTITLYALATLFGLKVTVRPDGERRIGSVAGFANGLVTGLTGSFVVPGVFYLQSLGLGRHELVQAMGILFTLSTLGLALALGSLGQFSWDDAQTSAFGVVPAVAGMVAGRWLRGHMSESVFRQCFLAVLMALGLFICVRELTGWV